MLCAICILIASQSEPPKLDAASPAVTTVRGTALCATHAVEKMGTLSVLQEIGQ